MKPMRNSPKHPYFFLLAGILCAVIAQAQDAPTHSARAESLVIANTTMLDGNGRPAIGPVSIYIRGDRIERIVPGRARPEQLAEVDTIIDGEGKYTLPGFINMHSHLHPSPAGRAQPLQYQYNLWLAAGITTMRDVGSDYELALDQRAQIAAGAIHAPRLLVYMWFPSGDLDTEGFEQGDAPTERDIRRMVRQIKDLGADGMKVRHFDRDSFLIIGDEARNIGLKIAHHVGVEDATAWDDAAVGTSTIEHWYGVPDAALNGVQEFPPDFNFNNELHRFRYAGRIWREADPDKLREVLQALINAGVAWDPTFSIYEACRDLQRAITNPALEHYLHPSLEAYFTPNPEYHGSFFFGWTNTDEVFWKENFRIWMDAVMEFSRMGGTVTTGEDAGYIYKVYGFGYQRELQMHEEAGFHPLEVIRHATHNGAKVLGMDQEIGRIKTGFRADLVVVNGNPLENLQILMPKGLNETLDSQRGEKGGIEWTIRDGVPYHAPTLLAEVRAMVEDAR